MLALVTEGQATRCCPDCGVHSARPHSWVRTRPRDLPVAGRQTLLTWTKRRWRCVEPSCPRATFTEHVPQIPPRHRLTSPVARGGPGRGGRRRAYRAPVRPRPRRVLADREPCGARPCRARPAGEGP
ncbi:transposase family protein [Actinospica robiniae]|uniref:transposase family protein n=1 Tax=Actinospica robiniae TaxID=304901 RepID=UPI00316AE2D7